VLRANGGSLSGSYGGHGGGGRLAVSYTAVAPGTAVAGLACDRGFKGTAEAGRGTIHLPDSQLLGTNLTVAWNGLYYGFNQWSPPSLTLTNSQVTFQETNFAFCVSNDLTLIGSLLDLKPLDMTCGGNLVLTNTAIGSTLHLRNTAYRSGSTNYGAVIGVTGTVSVAANCWIYPYSMNTNGASCFWQVGGLAINAGGGINADGLGWASSTTVGSGPGWGAQYGGGSHGGQGGRYAGGGVYDSSNTPMKAGSGGGGGQPANNPGGAGGGLIAMEIDGIARIDGTVTANGNGSTAGAGGAGGGICLQADAFDVAFGTIRANGGAANAVGGTPGGGGGGRIAMYSRIDNFDGTISSDGGASGSGYPGASGTVVRALTAGYLNLTIAGSPTRHGTASSLDYGANGGLQGDWVTNSVNNPADESNGVRYVCLGWTLQIDTGPLITNGSTTEAIFQLNTNVVLTWLWTNQFYLTASANTNGALQTPVSGWYTNGTLVTLTAVTNGGYYFLMWSDTGVPAGSHTNNPLTVTMNQARTIRANFASQTPGARVWTGTGDWLSPTNWSPAGVPNREDDITIASGTASIVDPTLFNAASLTVSGALRVASADLSVAHDVSISGASAYLLVSNLILRAGGNLTLTNGGDLYVYGGSTNGTTNAYTALVDIGGDVSAATNCWIYPYSHPIDGGSPWFRAANVTIQPGGGFDADGKGCAAGGGAYEQFWVPGQGRGWGKGTCGGSYGGQGGYQPGTGSYQGPGGGIYGDSNAPVHCGSGGGGGLNGSYAGAGGGLVHLEVVNRVSLEGTITAKGQRAVTQSAGGGSGGGIYITCRRFMGSTNGELRVDGGNFANGIYSYEGGGGGGRLAVWSMSPGASTNAVQVRYSATGGFATTYPGQPGTIVWGGYGPTGTSFMFR
jgi:hypothetical protein